MGKRDKQTCPVCGRKKLTVRVKKVLGITVRFYIRCNYCCHNAFGTTERSAYKSFWKDAVNEEELKVDSLYV